MPAKGHGVQVALVKSKITNGPDISKMDNNEIPITSLFELVNWLINALKMARQWYNGTEYFHLYPPKVRTLNEEYWNAR